MGMEKRFLFDGVALQSSGISPRNVERTTAIEADLADAGLTLGNRAAMAAGETANTIVVEFFVERSVRFPNSAVEDFTQGRHRNLLSTF
jgi:hypothetical protein